MIEGELALLEGGSRREGLPQEEREETPPVQGGGGAEAQKVEEGGHQVHVPHQPPQPLPPGGPAAQGGAKPEEEGNTHGGAIDEVGMGGLSVLAQAFPVVGGEDDDPSPQDPLLPQRLEELSQGLVHAGHFSGVGVPGIELGKGLGGIVGLVGIEVVHPEEKGLS